MKKKKQKSKIEILINRILNNDNLTLSETKVRNEIIRLLISEELK